MANFSSLKQAIQNYIKENGNKEITGNLLQEILLSMVVTMGDNAINGVLQLLSNERIARENADGLLSQALTAEQQRAIAAETKSAVLDGETKTLVFKNAAGQELYQVSVASLISNGLVDVEVDGTNLVMTFHTESGDEEITISIGDIFSPSNYYTKTQVDGLLLPITTAITNVSSRLNEGYIYLGVADPETIPTSATGKFFYIASQAGTYHFMTNGDIPIVISSNGLYILSGGVESDDWYLETIAVFTNNVQFNNAQLITSGGVFNAILPINDLLRRNYMLAGVADTTTIPTEDTNVFYLAGQGGTYTHFLNGDEEPLVLPKGFTVIYRGVEDDGWNYWVVYADNDFINTNRAQELSPAQRTLARTNMDVYSKTETYNKTELDNMITTPNQEYVTVTATAQTTDVTDLLPATGAADTVYRVGCWDGSHYDNTVYSEYAWNGSQYIYLSTKVGDLSKIPVIENMDNTDLDLSDENGYSVVRFKNGEIETKKFDSAKTPKTIDLGSYDFCVEDEHGSAIMAVGNGYPKTKNFNGEKIAKNVQKLNTKIEALDNSGFYKTVVINIVDYDNNLVNVFNAITPTKDVHYTILIPEGTYDVSSWFSQSQIENSNETQWRGLELPDYVKLLGVGRADKVVLQWLNNPSATHWGYISTLNTNHWHELENLTVKAQNIRYAVHDDVWDGRDRYIRVKNCIFEVCGNTTRAWGGGCNGGYDGVFENCKFIMDYYAPFESYASAYYIEPFVMHDNLYSDRDSYILFKNCRFVNPYTDVKYRIETNIASWQEVVYNSSYPMYDENKTDYAVNDCVNMPNDTTYSYKCLYANSKIPPYMPGRPCIDTGFGSDGASGCLYLTVEGCKLNTFLAITPILVRATGFANQFGHEPVLITETAEKKATIYDFI